MFEVALQGYHVFEDQQIARIGNEPIKHHLVITSYSIHYTKLYDLNVNVPSIKPEMCQGYAVTKAGYRYYGNDAHRHTNPRNNFV